MKWIISLSLLLSIIVGMTVLVTNEPGFVLFKYGDSSMETTLGVFLFSLLVAIVVLYVGLRLAVWLVRAPTRMRAWRHHRNHRKGEKALVRGLLAFYQGNWDAAESELVRNVSFSPSGLVSYLAAAQAAAGHGDVEQRDAYLRQARLHSPADEVTIGLTQAQLQLNAGESRQALMLLEQLHQHAPKHPQVLWLMARAYQMTGDWNLLLAVLPELERRKAGNTEALDRLSRTAYLGMLGKSAISGNAQQLTALWEKLPRNLRREQSMLVEYATLAITHKLAIPLAALLADSIRYQWRSDLVQLYGLAEGIELKSQIEQAEGWLRERPSDSALLLCLGRLCRRAQLWGKARDYLKAAAARGEPQASGELAQLFDQTNDHEQALMWYRKALGV